MRPCRTDIMEGIGNGLDPPGDHPFHREGFPLTCLPADLASMEGLEGDMMFNGAAGVRADLFVGSEPKVQRMVMNKGKDPTERIGQRHHQNEPAMGFSGRKGQYAGG